MSDTSSNSMREAIQSAIAENPVILFMKGTPEAPACGFSARTVAILNALEAPFAAVNVLVDPTIRQELSALSGWPTIPQLFIEGELVGGCDIVSEMYETGELQKLLGTQAAEGSGERASDGSLGADAGTAQAGVAPAQLGAEPAPLTIENLL
jgi:monothiol glutaredoxin